MLGCRLGTGPWCPEASATVSEGPESIWFVFGVQALPFTCLGPLPGLAPVLRGACSPPTTAARSPAPRMHGANAHRVTTLQKSGGRADVALVQAQGAAGQAQEIESGSQLTAV